MARSGARVRRRVGAVIVGFGGLLAGCASAPPVTSAASNTGPGNPSALRSAGDMANQTAHAGWDSVGQAYNGVGGAVRSPFRDFGLMNKSIPAVLARARLNPYDVSGLTSCDVVLEEVAALDAVLGPDMDNPEIKGRKNRYSSGADMAADAALQAAKDTIEHFIPMRGTIRNLSGASRAEAKQQKSQLAGSVRRGFLKSVGMAHNCSWPAAPMSFEPRPGGPVWPPVVVAVGAAPAPGPIMLASASLSARPSTLRTIPATKRGAASKPPQPVEPAPVTWRIGKATDAGASNP